MKECFSVTLFVPTQEVTSHLGVPVLHNDIVKNDLLH